MVGRVSDALTCLDSSSQLHYKAGGRGNKMEQDIQYVKYVFFVSEEQNLVHPSGKSITHEVCSGDKSDEDLVNIWCICLDSALLKGSYPLQKADSIEDPLYFFFCDNLVLFMLQRLHF